MRFKNKIVLITGASKGIGRATAIEFAKEGATVIINYNTSKSKAKEVQKNINDILAKNLLTENFEAKCLIIKADISSEVQVKNMIFEIIKEFKKIDILINNAGISIDLPFEEKEVTHWKKTLDVNLIGTFLTPKYVSKYMLENKYGKIVNVSSNSGINCFSPFNIDYDASKSGIISLTHNLAIQLQPYVNVSTIAPGWVNTEMNEHLSQDFIEEEKNKIYLKRFGEPEEIAKSILFLASEDADYINASILRIDGGYN